jgi:hypothetical protein
VSDRGGERAAAIYTLIGTAKLNDVDPQAWLADYMLKRWTAFTRFLDDGRICLTNNAAIWRPLCRALMKGGRLAFDHRCMFKTLVLQASHNLSDDCAEYLIRDPEVR